MSNEKNWITVKSLLRTSSDCQHGIIYRFQSLLKPRRLSGRLVTDINDLHSRIETLTKIIDYSKVTPQLEISRKQSLDFLHSALD